MGADLYIKDMARENQYTGYRRDLRVGYFRDSYNNSNILWQFGLSYWNDIADDFSNKKGNMSPTKTKKLLALLKELEPTFEKNLKDLLEEKNCVWDYDAVAEKVHKPAKLTKEERAGWVERYREDYEELKAFLQKAIDMGSAIICSV